MFIDMALVRVTRCPERSWIYTYAGGREHLSFSSWVERMAVRVGMVAGCTRVRRHM